MALQDPLNTDERDWSAPEHSGRRTYVCRGCNTILVDGDPFKFWNGWPWCLEPCYRRMQVLALDPDQREITGQERAARQDIERDDDQFNRSRR